MKKLLCVLVIFSTVSCKHIDQKNNNHTKVASSEVYQCKSYDETPYRKLDDCSISTYYENGEAPVPENTLSQCKLPLPEHFSDAPSPEERNALLERVIASQEGASFITVLSQARISKNQLQLQKFIKNTESFKSWVLRAITPLNMTCETVMGRDIIRYGEDAYAGFAEMILGFYSNQTEADLENYFQNEWQEYRSKGFLGRSERLFEAELLLAINSRIAGKNVTFRSGDIIHGVPLTIDEKESLTHIVNTESDPFVSIYEDQTAFVNDYCDCVKGEFLRYPDADTLNRRLKDFQNGYESLRNMSNPEQKILEIGKLTRQCVSIHPFADANGRTCQLWGASAAIRQGLVHSVLWPGEDVLLAEGTYAERYLKGYQSHLRLITTGSY